MKFDVTINGQVQQLEAEADAILLDILRDAGYKGVKYGCHEGVCGSCTVLVDGKATYACMTFVGQVAGHEITTIEGLGTIDAPHVLQESMVEAAAVQCGFCTPGMILSAKALLDEKTDVSRDDIAHALDGNLCRCTGYTKIFDGVEIAARKMRGES